MQQFVAHRIQQPIPKLRIRIFTNVFTCKNKFCKSGVIIVIGFFCQIDWLKIRKDSRIVVSELVGLVEQNASTTKLQSFQINIKLQLSLNQQFSYNSTYLPSVHNYFLV